MSLQGTLIATIIVLQTYHDKLAVTVMSGPHDPNDCFECKRILIYYHLHGGCMDMDLGDTAAGIFLNLIY